jgi:LacI family transcriptional regulator
MHVPAVPRSSRPAPADHLRHRAACRREPVDGVACTQQARARISAKTEKLIQDAAKTLNYRVNPMARALPTGRTNTLGLLLPTSPTDVLRRSARVPSGPASESGYTLILAESQESEIREAEAADRSPPVSTG